MMLSLFVVAGGDGSSRRPSLWLHPGLMAVHAGPAAGNAC